MTDTPVTHTPGPWRKGDHPFDVVADEYTVIATVAHDKQGLNRGREQSEANARLIIAAPDLLAAVKSLLAMMDTERPRKLDAAISWRENDELARNLAATAIRKVEGR